MLLLPLPSRRPRTVGSPPVQATVGEACCLSDRDVIELSLCQDLIHGPKYFSHHVVSTKDSLAKVGLHYHVLMSMSLREITLSSNFSKSTNKATASCPLRVAISSWRFSLQRALERSVAVHRVITPDVIVVVSNSCFSPMPSQADRVQARCLLWQSQSYKSPHTDTSVSDAAIRKILNSDLVLT